MHTYTYVWSLSTGVIFHSCTLYPQKTCWILIWSVTWIPGVYIYLEYMPLQQANQGIWTQPSCKTPDIFLAFKILWTTPPSKWNNNGPLPSRWFVGAWRVVGLHPSSFRLLPNCWLEKLSPRWMEGSLGPLPSPTFFFMGCPIRKHHKSFCLYLTNFGCHLALSSNFSNWRTLNTPIELCRV